MANRLQLFIAERIRHDECHNVYGIGLGNSLFSQQVSVGTANICILYCGNAIAGIDVYGLPSQLAQFFRTHVGSGSGKRPHGCLFHHAIGLVSPCTASNDSPIRVLSSAGNTCRFQSHRIGGKQVPRYMPDYDRMIGRCPIQIITVRVSPLSQQGIVITETEYEFSCRDLFLLYTQTQRLHYILHAGDTTNRGRGEIQKVCIA